MSLRTNRRIWESLAESDPYWAILSAEDKRDGAWDREEFFETGRQDVAGLLRDLAALEATPSLGRALDFGCGLGRLSSALATHFESVVGVDVASAMVRQATAMHRAQTNCIFLQNARSDLQLFGDATFDLVYSQIVLQHVSPDHAATYIQEFVRVTQPGGTIVFQIPSHLTPEYLKTERFRSRLRRSPLVSLAMINAARRLRNLPPEYDVTGIRTERVKQLLGEAGAEIVDIRENQSAGPPWLSFLYTAKVPA